MPFVAQTTDCLSDLIVHEQDPSVGYSRKNINVTPAGVCKIGTLVYRAKATPAFDGTETAEVTFANVTGEKTLVLAGLTVTVASGETATAKDIAQAFATGETVGKAVVTGTLTGYTVELKSDKVVVFTSTTANTNVTDLANTGSATDPTIVVVNGVAGNRTYTTVTSADHLVNTNEFAVVFGDHFGYNPSFTPRTIAAGMYNAVAIVGGNIQLKEYYIKKFLEDKDIGGQLEVAKELLEAQGIQVLKTV